MIISCVWSLVRLQGSDKSTAYDKIDPKELPPHGRGVGGTPYVGWYVMLGYTWVVFEKFLYFFREIGTFFQQNFCIFSPRWVSILKKISVFVEQMEPICKKFSVFYSTKLVQFTHKISVCCKMGIVSGHLL